VKDHFNTSIDYKRPKRIVILKALIISLTAIISPSIWSSSETCLLGTQSSHPIDEHRSSGAFEVSKLACENTEPDFLIQDSLVLRNIRKDVSEYFCSSFEDTNSSVAGNGVCTSERQFNFIEHSERVQEFIEVMGATLEQKIVLPDNYTESSNSQHIRALMFLCTNYTLEKLGNIITSEATDAEKERAIELLAHKGLLGHFLTSRPGREFLTNTSIPLSLRTKAVKSFLDSPNSTRERIEYLTKFYSEHKDSTGPRREFANILNLSFKEYLEQDPTTLNRQTLSILNSYNIDGVQEVISSLGQSEFRNTTGPGGRVIASVADTSTPNQTRPNCSQTQPLTPEGYRAIINPLDKFLTLKSAKVGSGFPVLTNPINRWSWYEDSFESDSRWSEIEFSLNESNATDGIPNVRAFYCFVENITSSFSRFLELPLNHPNKNQIANEIFEKITLNGAETDFLSIMGKLLPSLSEANQLAAIDIIDDQVSLGTTANIDSLRTWRKNTLSELIDENTHRLSGTLVSRAIAALANNGGADEEHTLATYFQRYDDETFRQNILAQYDDPSLISSVGTNMRLLRVLETFTPQAKRDEYLRVLATKISSMDASTMSFRNGATDSSRVYQANLEAIVEGIDAISGDDMGSLLAKMRQQAEGVNDHISGNNRNEVTLRPTRVNSNIAITGQPSGSLSSGSPPSGNRVIKSKSIQESIRSAGIGGTNIRGTPVNLNGENPIISAKIASLKAEVQSSELEGENQQRINNEAAPIEDSSPLAQDNFFSSIAQNLGFPSTGQNENFSPPIIPTRANIGEQRTAVNTSSFDNSISRTNSTVPKESFATDDSTEASSTSSKRSEISNNSDRELLREVEKLSNDTSNLKNQINRLDAPTNIPTPATGLGPSSPLAQNNFNQVNPSRATTIGDNSVGQGNQNQNQRAPASVADRSGSAPSGYTSPSQSPAIANNAQSEFPLNQSILSPFDNPTQQDLSKVIKIQSIEQKNLLMNYMAAKEDMNCPELRFIQDFYQTNIDNFILSKRRKPWREYALLELEGINFRFNYPGAANMRQEIKETCATLAGERPSEMGESTRAPASISELIPEEARPAQEEKSLIKKFMLKLGL
jgi:hypothetical protein